jgi:hypothetical protein
VFKELLETSIPNFKNELIGLYKDRKTNIMKQVDLKKHALKLIEAKEREMKKLGNESGSELSLNTVARLARDLRNSLNIEKLKEDNYRYLIESLNIHHRIMIVALNLASEPKLSVNMQKKRRQFYDKCKEQVNKKTIFLVKQKQID